MASYDKVPVKDGLIEILSFYAGSSGKKTGTRTRWVCPGCGKERLEAKASVGGCWNEKCAVPRSTDAPALIAHFEGLDPRSDFPKILKRGYEILALEDPKGAPKKAAGPSNSKERLKKAPKNDRRRREGERYEDGERWDRRSRKAEKESANGFDASRWTTGANKRCAEDRKDGQDPRQDWVVSATAGEEELVVYDGVTVQAEEAASLRTVSLRQLRAYARTRAGLNRAIEAVVIEEAGQGRLSSLADLWDAVYEEVLRLCPLEERDVRFWKGRGVSYATMQEGRFGSISERRARAVVRHLRERFGEEALLRVPGFRKNAWGRLVFTLTGDYTLIPYHDPDSGVTTIEGRAVGRPKRGMGKYVSLSGSGSHLYVFPRYLPEHVEAFCEGAMGAIVAAQNGIAVAGIQGFRRYRAPGEAERNPLPELRGVDFEGRRIPYIPDVDDPTKEEVIAEAPKAAEALVGWQNGAPALALLPDGKDLDEWLFSLRPSSRRALFSDLIAGAQPLRASENRALRRKKGGACGAPAGDERSAKEEDTTEGREEGPEESSAEEDTSIRPPEWATYEYRLGPSEELITGEEVRHSAAAVVFGLILWGAVLPVVFAYLALPSIVEEHPTPCAIIAGLAMGAVLWILRRNKRLREAHHLRGR